MRILLAISATFCFFVIAWMLYDWKKTFGHFGGFPWSVPVGMALIGAFMLLALVNQ